MWKCPNCGQTIEDAFDSCWNCGTACDGTVDPGFHREPDDPAVPDPGEDAGSGPDPSQLGSTQQSTSGNGGMNRHEIAVLICKTLALFMFAQAAFFSVAGIVLTIVMFASAPFRGGLDWSQIYLSLIFSVPVLAVLIVGLVYWKQSEPIASRMVSAGSAPVTSLSISVQEVMMVAFSTAGVFILIDGARDFAGVLLLVHSYSFTVSELWRYPQTYSALIQAAAALWLILGSRGIVRVVHRLQTAGTPHARDDGE